MHQITRGRRPTTLNHRSPRLTNLYVHQVFGMTDMQALGTSG
ncbi:hypothetical protein [Streptomyces pristinaespiralis]